MKNLIMNMFNVDSKDIDKFDTSNGENGAVEIIIRLKRKGRYCPSCGNKLVGNGISRKYINLRYYLTEIQNLYTKPIVIVAKFADTVNMKKIPSH